MPILMHTFPDDDTKFMLNEENRYDPKQDS